MPFVDIFSDILSSLSFSEAYAEAPPAEGDSEDKSDEGGEEEEKGEEGEKEEGSNDDGGDDGEDEDGGDDEEEEEEEEEEEPEDIKPKLEEGTSRLSSIGIGKHFELIQWLSFRGYRVSLASKHQSCSLDDTTPSFSREASDSACLLYSALTFLKLQNLANTNSRPCSIECAKSSECAPLKHHYEACAERVQRQEADENHKGPKEDCVEECT